MVGGGGGGHCRLLSCCAKTVDSRQMKLCDFKNNYKGYHFKKLQWKVTYSVAMAMLLSRSAWLKLSSFCEKWPVFHSKGTVLILVLVFVETRNQRFKVGLCSKFQPDWTKDKRCRISTLKLLDDIIVTL